MAIAPTLSKERRLWARAAACALAIYCSTPLVRPVANYLRDRNLLRIAVAITFAIAAAWILRVLLRHRLGRREVQVLICFGLLYATVLSSLPLPEERIHYLEYGLLAGFIYSALVQQRNHRAETAGLEIEAQTKWELGPVLGAIGLNALLGWVDEGIQAMLPDRHYDLRDILMNTVAGAIAVAAIVALRHGREQTRRSRPLD
jgi:hypothetical protein